MKSESNLKRAPALTSLSTDTTTNSSNKGLSNIAKAAGKKYFGSATDNPELADISYVAELSNINEFGQITPVSIFKLVSEKIRHGWDKRTFLFEFFRETVWNGWAYILL